MVASPKEQTCHEVFSLTTRAYTTIGVYSFKDSTFLICFCYNQMNGALSVDKGKSISLSKESALPTWTYSINPFTPLPHRVLIQLSNDIVTKLEIEFCLRSMWKLMV